MHPPDFTAAFLPRVHWEPLATEARRCEVTNYTQDIATVRIRMCRDTPRLKGDLEALLSLHTLVWGLVSASTLRDCSRTTDHSEALVTRQQHRGPRCKVYLSDFRSEQTALLQQKHDLLCEVKLLRLNQAW